MNKPTNDLAHTEEIEAAPAADTSTGMGVKRWAVVGAAFVLVGGCSSVAPTGPENSTWKAGTGANAADNAQLTQEPPFPGDGICQYLINTPPQVMPQSSPNLYAGAANCPNDPSNPGGPNDYMCPGTGATGCTPFTFDSGAGIIAGQNCSCIPTTNACTQANITVLMGNTTNPLSGLDSDTYAVRVAAQQQVAACCTTPTYLGWLRAAKAAAQAAGTLDAEVNQSMGNAISTCQSQISNCYGKTLTVNSSYACQQSNQHAPPPVAYAAANIGGAGLGLLTCSQDALLNWNVNFSVTCPTTSTFSPQNWNDPNLASVLSCNASSGSSESYTYAAGAVMPPYCANTVLTAIVLPADITAAKNAMAAALNAIPAPSPVCTATTFTTGTGNGLVCN